MVAESSEEAGERVSEVKQRMGKMRDSMVFYRSFAEAIEELDEEDQLTAFWNIVRYALDGEEPEEAGPARAVFRMAKPQIDANEKRYRNGMKGGRPKTESKPKENQNETKQKPNVQNAKPNENVNVNVNENERKEKLKEKSTQEQSFEEFWEMYPKKKSKGQAKMAWNKLNPGRETIKAIMEKLPELIKSPEWKKEGGQYIPYPATWLNAEGWNDEVGKAPKPKQAANSFNNFEQREYDYEELERKLFQSSMRGEGE